MPELTLHFEAGPGTDVDAAAAALREQLQGVPQIESAQTSAQRFQAIGPAEVISAIQIGTQIAQNSALFLGAVTALITAWQALKTKFPNLHAPTVEVGLKQIPLDQLTDAHRAKLMTDPA